MDDLPSEDPEESGLPDEFHDLQPQLLSATLRLSGYPRDQIFTGTDLNLYYDVRHPQWYKRPDWFLVVGVPRLYDGTDLRSSYVIWQEGVDPFVVVELLSPGTEKDDLGEYADLGEGSGQGNPVLSISTDAEPVVENGAATRDTPLRKWEVYEQSLRVPYYIVFDRYTNALQAFQLEGNHYQPQALIESRVWLPSLGLGVGLWQGEYRELNRLWLRWYDANGNWIPLKAELERQRTEQERQRAERLAERLRQAGIDPADV